MGGLVAYDRRVDDAELDFYLDRLSELELELRNYRQQLITVSNQHRRDKISAFYGSDGATIRDRENVAEWNVIDLTEDIARLKFEIQAREDERDHIKFTVTHRVAYARA